MFFQLIENFSDIIIISFVCEIIFFFIFLFTYYLISTVNNYLQRSIQLLRWRSFFNIFSNQQHFSYLIHDYSAHDDNAIYSSTFQNSIDLMPWLNNNEIIENINLAASELLGCSADKLFRGHILSIFLPDQFKDISTQLKWWKPIIVLCFLKAISKPLLTQSYTFLLM
jgi:PAS domain-containing protein